MVFGWVDACGGFGCLICLHAWVLLGVGLRICLLSACFVRRCAALLGFGFALLRWSAGVWLLR